MLERERLTKGPFPFAKGKGGSGEGEPKIKSRGKLKNRPFALKNAYFGLKIGSRPFFGVGNPMVALILLYLRSKPVFEPVQKNSCPIFGPKVAPIDASRRAGQKSPKE